MIQSLPCLASRWTGQLPFDLHEALSSILSEGCIQWQWPPFWIIRSQWYIRTGMKCCSVYRILLRTISHKSHNICTPLHMSHHCRTIFFELPYVALIVSFWTQVNGHTYFLFVQKYLKDQQRPYKVLSAIIKLHKTEKIPYIPNHSMANVSRF